MKPKLTRSFAPRTRPVAGAWRALIISSSRSSALAEIKEPPADNAAAPAVARAMNSRRVDFFAMRIVLPIVYFRRSIAAQEKFAQKVKGCLMAKTLDLIRGYMLSHRMEPRGAGTGSDTVLTKYFTWKSCRLRSRRRYGLCCKNSLIIQDVAVNTCSLPLWNVAKIFFATEPIGLTSTKFLYREAIFFHVSVSVKGAAYCANVSSRIKSKTGRHLNSILAKL